jgi:outer membrane protein TolC
VPDNANPYELSGGIPSRIFDIPRPLSALLALCLLASPASGQTATGGQSTSSAITSPGQTGARNQPGTSDPNTVSLTMHEAVKLALKQNPRVVAARLEALESRQTTKVARSTFLPKASLGLEEQIHRLNLATLIGKESYPYSVGPYSNAQLDVNFDVPIIAVSAWRSYQAEKQREKSSQEQAVDAQESIASIVVAQYLSLLRSKATEETVQSRIDLAAALLRLANDQLAQGTGTSTDALRANVELHVEKENLVRAQAQTRAYGYGLAQVLGLNENQHVVATETLTAADVQVPDEQQSLAQAFYTRPDLLSAEALGQAAKYDDKAAASQRLPEFHFDGYWAQTGRNPAGALPAYAYQAEMRLPLFTGGRITAEAHRARLAADRSQQTVTQRRDVITQQVRTALSSLDAARQELQLTTETLRLSTRELTESRDRFAAGITNNIEVITAQNSLAQATDGQIGAMYDLQQAKADLSYARGRIAEEYGN